MFSKKVCEELKWYVYLYIDPRTGHPFYIGKGKGNRVFAHLKDRGDCEKVKIIEDLRHLGLQPVLEFLKYGLENEKDALLVESIAIDLVDVNKLTNEVRGHGSRSGSRGSVLEIARMLESDEVRIDEPSLLINVTHYRSSMSSQEIYDQTRSAWKVGPNRNKVELVFCIHDRIIREVYRPQTWVPGGSTKRAADHDGSRAIEADRYEFVGRIADERIRHKYLGKKVRAEDFDPKSQNPVRYVNLVQLAE